MDEGALNRQWRRKLSALVALAETYLQCSFQFSFVSTIMPRYRIIVSHPAFQSNCYDAGGRVLPLCHYFIILTH